MTPTKAPEDALVEKLLAWRDDRREIDEATMAGQHPNTELLTEAADAITTLLERERRLETALTNLLALKLAVVHEPGKPFQSLKHVLDEARAALTREGN